MTNEMYFEKTFKITDENIKRFAKISGDNNPLHLSNKYAKNTIFKGRICHGMLIGSYISAIVGNDFPGIGTIYVSQNLVFKKPVRIDDDITIRVSFVEPVKKNRVKLEITCKNQFGDIVIEGQAIVVPPASFLKNLI
jgi:3-hydroxybutyryl-CoA dehydratase